MIYCIPTDDYDKHKPFLEELSYNDENSYEWRIARTKKGFLVKYFGVDYFKDSEFNFTTTKGEHFRIKNTNCIQFLDDDFEAFCDMRDIIMNGWTDEIWGAIEELFQERFEHDTRILESECF
jgi:hypothetical protein